LAIAGSWNPCRKFLKPRTRSGGRLRSLKAETLGKLLENPVAFSCNWNPRSLADIESDIRVVAGLLGRNSAAVRVISAMRKEIRSDSSPATRGTQKLRVLLLRLGPTRASLPTVGRRACPTLQRRNLSLRLALVFPTKNVAQSKSGRPIILAWACLRAIAQNPQKLTPFEKWRDVPAIPHRRVFVVRDELLNTPAPISLVGTAELARILSPMPQTHDEAAQ